MKKITTLVAAVALSSALVSSASAQVAPVGPASNLPQSVQNFIANAGGLTAGAIVSVVAIGALLIITVTKSDGTTVTTTTTATN